MSTAIYSHPDCLLHDMGDWHPESPARLRAIEDQLILARLDGLIEQCSAPLADEAAILRNHSRGALDLVRATENHVRTLVVVGHNPTMASLAALLDDGEGEESASNDISMGFPTCALVVFSYDGEWKDLDEASASALAYHVGRG